MCMLTIVTMYTIITTRTTGHNVHLIKNLLKMTFLFDTLTGLGCARKYTKQIEKRLIKLSG